MIWMPLALMVDDEETEKLKVFCVANIWPFVGEKLLKNTWPVAAGTSIKKFSFKPPTGVSVIRRVCTPPKEIGNKLPLLSSSGAYCHTPQPSPVKVKMPTL